VYRVSYYHDLVLWADALSLPSLKILSEMPKMKTNSSAKKRFSLTGTGKVKRRKAYKRHILTKKEHDQKNRLSKTVIVSDADMKRVKKMLLI
jgi:large subunit ribosomal protein L35